MIEGGRGGCLLEMHNFVRMGGIGRAAINKWPPSSKFARKPHRLILKRQSSLRGFLKEIPCLFVRVSEDQFEFRSRLISLQLRGLHD